MRFSSHEPGKETAAGLFLLAASVMVAAGVAYGVSTARAPGRALIPGLTGAFLSLGLALAGLTKLKDGAAMRRERRFLEGRGRPAAPPGLRFRPAASAVRVLPAPAPPWPTRRLIAVTVMFAGLILPAVCGAFWVVGEASSAFSVGFLAIASWLSYNAVALWKGRLWMTAVGTFVFGFLAAGAVLVPAALEPEWRVIPWAAAATSHFALGLLALFSLRPWLNRLEWSSGRDPLATSDKPAVLAALRARKGM